MQIISQALDTPPNTLAFVVPLVLLLELTMHLLESSDGV